MRITFESEIKKRIAITTSKLVKQKKRKYSNINMNTKAKLLKALFTSLCLYACELGH